MSNVCKLARPLIVRIISLQPLHPVTLVPIITLASVLLLCSSPPLRWSWREAPQGQAVSITRCDSGFGECAG